MAIYILHNDPSKCAEMLDDKSLDLMIKDIAQVLCNTHREGNRRVYDPFLLTIPLAYRYKNKCINSWTQWARECKANYLYLVELAATCLNEASFRSYDAKYLESLKKWFTIIIWCNDNVPDLPYKYSSCHSCDYGDDAPCVCDSVIYNNINYTNPPLVMPEKYITDLPWSCDGCGYDDLPHDCDVAEEVRIIESYRNYYQAKFKTRIDRLMTQTDSVSDDLWQEMINVFWTNRKKPDWLQL